MKKNKENKKLFEDVTIDSRAAAQAVLESAAKSKEKIAKGMKMALISELCWGICFLCAGICSVTTGNVSAVFESLNILAALPAVVLALVALIMSGGVKSALGICFKIGGIAWTLIPIIIVDLFIAATAVCFALCGVFLVPVLFVYLEKRKACKDYDLAEQYLNHVENVDVDNIVDLSPEEVAVANA